MMLSRKRLEWFLALLLPSLYLGAAHGSREECDGTRWPRSSRDGDHNAPTPSSGGADGPSPLTQKRQRDTHRRTRLHWDTPEGMVNSNSVWALVEEDEELEQIEIDEGEFASLFQAAIKSTSVNAASGGSKAGGGGRNVVQVIDPKRANNGGIILASLRMSYDDMAKAVVRM